MDLDLDRERLERCLAHVVAYRASGLKATAWAAANGVELLELQSWCAHSKRWRARLDGVTPAPRASPASPMHVHGFVAAQAAAAPAPPAPCCVRIEIDSAGIGRVALQWPLSHIRELSTWLRELNR